MYIEGIIDKEELKKRTEKQQSLIQTKKEEIRTIEESLAEIKTSKSDEDRLKAIRRFKESWDAEGIEREELNKLAKEQLEIKYNPLLKLVMGSVLLFVFYKIAN